ncbi:MAG: class I SAM-dependent methyltransferase [Acidimicrobiales bacterium]
MTSAATRWRSALEARAIPASILARAPASPHGFSVEVFSRIADDAVAGPPDPSTRRADDGLPDGGDVLDVGCGAGSASLPIAARAGRLIGVDESAGLLEAFAARADRLGVDHVEINGWWPDVAGAVPSADVVVCRHVAYNVPDLDPFLRRLTDHARRRVVLHLTLEHPLAWMAPYWQRLHGLTVTEGPGLDDAVEVAAEAEIEVEIERWDESFDLAGRGVEEHLAFLRRRLCLADDRDDELRAALADLGLDPVRPVATVWWPGTAR